MATESTPSLFISYSRTDEAFITPVVEILRVTGALVFQDKDSIPKGKPWKAEIVTAVEACTAMLVFWCTHSGESQEVKKEYSQAIREGKDVVPVMLDDTTLTKRLARYQGISMRGIVRGHEDVAVVEREKPQGDRITTERVTTRPHADSHVMNYTQSFVNAHQKHTVKSDPDWVALERVVEANAWWWPGEGNEKEVKRESQAEEALTHYLIGNYLKAQLYTRLMT